MNAKQILSDLTIRKGESAAITGTGGKTTLLWYLAMHLKDDCKVVASVTAKMFPPGRPLYQKLILNPAEYDSKAQPEHSVYLAADGQNEAGKLLGISAEMAEKLKSPDNCLIMEADGSRGLPLKMWYDHEPPVPESADLTLGIIPAAAINLPVSPERVYNFEGFAKATGLRIGDPAAPKALASLILDPCGLFKNSAGRKILIINQCDDDELFGRAKALSDAILNHPRRQELTAIICMSLKELEHENYSHYTCRRIIPENETE